MHTHRATVIDHRIAKSGRNGKSLARESRNPARMATTPRERAEKAAETADQRATRNADPARTATARTATAQEAARMARVHSGFAWVLAVSAPAVRLLRPILLRGGGKGGEVHAHERPRPKRMPYQPSQKRNPAESAILCAHEPTKAADASDLPHRIRRGLQATLRHIIPRKAARMATLPSPSPRGERRRGPPLGACPPRARA
jgi:hypothetical protein